MPTAIEDSAPTLGEKVEFLSRAETYGAGEAVVRRETHMSWVFLVGDRVYKLKKPVRFPYLDFSTLSRREAVCRTELKLNRRLAPDVYLDVLPLVSTPHGLSIGGAGTVVDWLVVMLRLGDESMLERLIADRRLEARQLERLVDTLTQFYRRAAPTSLSPDVFLAEWRRSLNFNLRVLLDPGLGMPSGLVRGIDRIQRNFLARRADVLVARMHHRRIVEGHGDLRPEHIWLGDRVRIIDCLEFNVRLRTVDPFDDIAFLSLECERLGARWAGDHVARRMKRALRDGPSDELFTFYRCHRAVLRARLAIAHLLEPNPRTPEKWPRLAREYLRIAAADARRLQRMIGRAGTPRGDRPQHRR